MILRLMSLSASHSNPSLAGKERRSQGRYPVLLELDCRLIGTEEIVRGRTADITSSGVRFRVDRAFPIGEAVELRIKWPTLFPESLPVTLVLEGRVVRSGGGETALQTIRYRFGSRTMIGIRELKGDREF